MRPSHRRAFLIRRLKQIVSWTSRITVFPRRRGNTVILDVQDTICFKRRIKNARLWDGLIFKSRRALEDFATDRSEPVVLYHQWDPRYRPHQAGLEELKVAYLGHRRSLK